MSLAHVLQGFKRIINDLQAQLDRLEKAGERRVRLGWEQGAKVYWNEDWMQEHLGELRSQAEALQLFLQSSQL